MARKRARESGSASRSGREEDRAAWPKSRHGRGGREYEHGELVERTLDYYAQHRDGSVWYVGERVKDYEGGKVVGHEGQWLAGDGNATLGVFVPAEPRVGETLLVRRHRATSVRVPTSEFVSFPQTSPALVWAVGHGADGVMRPGRSRIASRARVASRAGDTRPPPLSR